MTPRFILDENIVILAQQGLDERGNPSPVCAELVQRIIEICHTIVVDDVLWDKFDEQLNRPGHQLPQAGPNLLRVLYNALTTAGKIDGLGHTAPVFDEEGSIPSGSTDDTYIVRLAVESGAILVTTDGALRDDLRESGIQDTYGLTVVSPDEALGNCDG